MENNGNTQNMQMLLSEKYGLSIDIISAVMLTYSGNDIIGELKRVKESLLLEFDALMMLI